MSDLDLSALASGPDPVLAQASDVRARGDQRTRRARALVAGPAALVVLAATGTAVALSSGGRPDALRTAGTPTATPSATAPDSGRSFTPPRDSKLTWAVFPSVTRMAALVPGDWTSGQVQVTEALAENLAQADRCAPAAALHPPRSRVLVTRALQTTDRSYRMTFAVEDFASSDDASTVLGERLSDLRKCPTVDIDGPGAGSVETSTVLDSSAAAFTLQRRHHECKRDHAGCSDLWSVWTTKRSGHLLLTVVGHHPGKPLPFSEVDEAASDFEQSVRTFYGHEPTPLTTPTTQPAAVGGTYYAAVLWDGNEGQTSGEAAEQERAAGWGNVLTTRLDCLDGAAAAVNRDHPGASHGDVVALLFDTSQSAEDFVNTYDGVVVTVARVTVRCLT